MPSPFLPSIQPAIFALRPDYVAFSLVAEGIANAARHPVADAALTGLATPDAGPAWGAEHCESWRAAYRAFGAKPQRTPSSAEALRQRLQRDGALPSINAVVDLYNAISVRYALPVGGEDIDRYASTPVLMRASGTETFDTIKEGAPYLETVPAGEVVWADARGVTCRRWNWRQGTRTRIEAGTTRMWFVLERLEPMPVPALLEAGQCLAGLLRRMNPAAHLTMALLDRGGTTMMADSDPTISSSDLPGASAA
jgi:DNA/RNA-binding domain of Phe-tRNA-synthetase-like protein